MAHHSDRERLANLLIPLYWAMECGDHDWADEMPQRVTQDITPAQIHDWRVLPHDGDCTRSAHSCITCLAENVWHACWWIAGRLIDCGVRPQAQDAAP